MFFWTLNTFTEQSKPIRIFTGKFYVIDMQTFVTMHDTISLYVIFLLRKTPLKKLNQKLIKNANINDERICVECAQVQYLPRLIILLAKQTCNIFVLFWIKLRIKLFIL